MRSIHITIFLFLLLGLFLLGLFKFLDSIFQKLEICFKSLYQCFHMWEIKRHRHFCIECGSQRDKRERALEMADRVQSTEIISLEANYFSYLWNSAIIANAKDTQILPFEVRALQYLHTSYNLKERVLQRNISRVPEQSSSPALQALSRDGASCARFLPAREAQHFKFSI
jgi:hypothetical protein